MEWELGNTVKHIGELWKITNMEIRMEYDGISAWSGDDYIFTLENVNTGKEIVVE